MSRIIISLCGRKRTGKESAFKLILSYVKRPEEFQFATPLKKFCIDVLGLTEDQCYGPSSDRESPTKYYWSDVANEIRSKYGKNAKDGLTARDVLQVVGTDLMRLQFYKDVWADAGIYAAMRSTAATCIFTDTRFPNEVTACRKSPQMDSNFTKPILIRLYRDTGLTDSHDSETALDSLDIVPNQKKIYFKGSNSVEDRLDAEHVLQTKGYSKITEYLWKATNDECGFDYLVDNNHTLDILKDNMVYILKDRNIYLEPTLS